METLLAGLCIIAGAGAVGYVIGAGFALGYNLFKNKTKKVCDLCFREIKAINDQYKKYENEKRDREEDRTTEG